MWEHIPQSHQNGFCTYIWSCGNTSHSHIRMASALTYDHVGTHPTVTSEWILQLYLIMWEHILESHQNGSYTYIWSCRNTSHSHIRMASTLISDHVGTHPTVTSEWLLHLYLTMGGTNPTSMSEWLSDSSLPFRGSLDLENTKLLPEVLKLHSG